MNTLLPAPRRDLLVVIVMLAALLAGGIACASPAGVPDAAFEPAFKHFIAASSGDTAEIDPAADQFDALLKTDPANPVLMAYAGASTAMRARTTMLPWKKMHYAEDGLALIDKALTLSAPAPAPAHDAPLQHGTPGSLEARFVAANAFLAVPPFMNRGARGAKLLADVLASPLFAQAPLAFRGTVWMRAAALATQEQRSADAQRFLNEVISRQAPQADQARALLKGAA
ncbi:MAG TPA: hypothetical protein VGM74_11085 [Burkholderiaceae bacterium]|jgi:hypothetical protein